MRVLIADDHEVVRKGVGNILKSRLNVAAAIEAANDKEAVEKARELNPELVILGVAMPVLDGFFAAERIKKALPHVPILMFSMHDGPEVIQPSKLVQARGFCHEIGTRECCWTLWRPFFAARISLQTVAISKARGLVRATQLKDNFRVRSDIHLVSRHPPAQ